LEALNIPIQGLVLRKKAEEISLKLNTELATLKDKLINSENVLGSAIGL
jgi:hypothetical protein